MLCSISAEAAESIRVMALFTNKAVVRIDGSQRMLSAGMTSPEGIKLISANSREAILEVDGKRGTYKLGSHISGSYSAPSTRSAMVQITPNSSGMYVVTGSINGFSVSFLVDTGASVIAMNAIQAKRLGIDYRVTGQPSRTATASGIAESYLVKLARVRVGEIELRDIWASVIDGPHPREVLLGMSFLSRLDMSREGKLLKLKKKRY
ncbi:MAG: TIGR02281 family clan AA aspartic protease [Gammaproteobacteria bacterium]|nr:TIGR02281 family clan AA aspartic protease [Gammaproteobacteria bacterium]